MKNCPFELRKRAIEVLRNTSEIGSDEIYLKKFLYYIYFKLNLIVTNFNLNVNLLLFVQSQHTMTKYSVETSSLHKHTGKHNEIHIRKNARHPRTSIRNVPWI
jgi:hypothetical protein